MDTIFAYPPVPQTGQRALMARFSAGQEHLRRRGYAVEALSRIKVPEAQAKAAAATREAATGTVDVIPLARRVIVETLEGLLDEESPDPEIAAARAGILLQARDATAGLVANALLHGASTERTLRDHPPVVNTRRIVAGEEIVIDLHGRPFGGEPRPCPGQELAIALATAIVEVLRTGELLPFDGTYEDWPNMRIPARLEVSFR